MAFTPEDPNDPNNLQNQPGGNSPMNQVPQTASGIGSGAGGVSGPQGAVSTPSSTKAPPFTDLGAYLRANAPQTQEMAGKIAENLGQQAQQVQTDVQTGTEAFNDAVKSGSVQANPDLVTRAVSQPAQFTQNPEDVAAFVKQRDANYTGPANFESSDAYTRLSGEIQQAAEKAPNPSNPNDFAPFVRSMETNPTWGMTALDNLLLQGNPDAAATITTARAPFAQFKDTLGNIVSTGNAAATKAAADTAAARSGAQGALSNAQTTQSDKISGALKTLQDQIDAYNASLGTNQAQTETDVSDFARQFSDFLNSQQFATYTPARDPSLGSVVAKNFYGQPGNPGAPSTQVQPINLMPGASLENAVTPEDLQAIQALELLSGDPNWNPASGVSEAKPLTVPSGNPYAGSEKSYAQSLLDYLGNIAFGSPTNNPLGNGSPAYGWVPATSGKTGENTGGGNFAPVANANLQALLDRLTAAAR